MVIDNEIQEPTDQYYSKSIKNNKKTAFGAISHKRMVPMSITTMRNSTHNMTSDDQVSNYLQNEPAEEYTEGYVHTEEVEGPPNYELMGSNLTRPSSNKMSQPIINRQPITQHGAVKAVNLFGSLMKDTISTQPETSAVTRPKAGQKAKSAHILADFGH